MQLLAHDQDRFNKIAAPLAIILFNLMIYTSFVSFTLRPRQGERLGPITFWALAAILIGCCIFPTILKLCRTGRKSPPSLTGALKMFPMVLFLTASLPTLWFGFEIWIQDNPVRHCSNFAWCLLVPSAFHAFYRNVPAHRRGLWFGLGFAGGIFYWWLLMAIAADMRSEIDGTPHPALYLVYLLQIILVHSLSFLLLYLFVIAKAEATPHTGNFSPLLKSRRPKNDARILVLAAVLTYVMNSAIDIRLFPFISMHTMPELKFWLAIPILALVPIGWLLDRDPVGTFKRLALFCAIVFILTPSLLALDDAPLLYNIIYATTTFVQFVIFITFATILADLLPIDDRCGMYSACLFGLRLVSVLFFLFLRSWLYVSEGILIFGATAFAIAFKLLVRHVDFIRETPPETVIAEPAPPPAVPFVVPPEAPSAPVMAPTHEASAGVDSYLESRHLTPRELEVARLVLRGLSTREIGARLAITEHTVKTHVKNILDKFGLPHRKAFVSNYLMHSESLPTLDKSPDRV